MTEGTGLERKRRGAWYTPADLVDVVVSNTFDDWDLEGCLAGHGRTLRVLDPACGDGRFLMAVGRELRRRGIRASLVGVDIDASAVSAAAAVLESAGLGHHVDVTCGNALARRWGDGSFDVIVGNPPFLSPLARATAHGVGPHRNGGPYADAAVEFLALAARMVAPGGRIGLILPQSVLASRDAGAVRADVERRCSRIWSWWSQERMFDASVFVCAMGFEARAAGGRRSTVNGRDPGDVRDGEPWTDVITRSLGVPAVDTSAWRAEGTLGDRAKLSAGFRDEYYALVPAVVDEPGHAGDGDGDADVRGDDGGGAGGGNIAAGGVGARHDGVVARPPLVTSGVIDPGACLWGRVPVRFAKRRHMAPRVDISLLPPKMQEWAASMLVPKVLVANQTKVIEAVADPEGRWLPGVPVVSAFPGLPPSVTVWEIAAVLTSPTASAWAWHEAAGTGMSSRGLRLSPRLLARLPWPAGTLDGAVRALKSGDVEGCGRAIDRAYGTGDDELASWWLERLPDRLRGRKRGGSPGR